MVVHLCERAQRAAQCLCVGCALSAFNRELTCCIGSIRPILSRELGVNYVLGPNATKDGVKFFIAYCTDGCDQVAINEPPADRQQNFPAW